MYHSKFMKMEIKLINNTLCQMLFACFYSSAVKSMANSSLCFKNIDGLLKQAIATKEHISGAQGRR